MHFGVHGWKSQNRKKRKLHLDFVHQSLKKSLRICETKDITGIEKKEFLMPMKMAQKVEPTFCKLLKKMEFIGMIDPSFYYKNHLK